MPQAQFRAILLTAKETQVQQGDPSQAIAEATHCTVIKDDAVAEVLDAGTHMAQDPQLLGRHLQGTACACIFQQKGG